MSVLIDVADLTLGWGTRVLLEHLSFQVQRGEIFVIMGGSGSGKSTLMRHMIGLETPISGQVQIGCRPHAGEGEAPRFGVMFQSGALLGSMTVGENVGLPLTEWTALPPDAVSALVRAKLQLVDLEGAEDKLPSELSGGMKKRAAIARAMILEPDLLFLDEPSAGLDPVTSAELDQLIGVLNRNLGTTVVMVTHELESVFSIGQRCILLDRETKTIIAQGDPRELRDHSSDPKVVAFFRRQPMSKRG